MSISIKQLQIFVAIAHTKQVSLAAEQCFITQSAASMAISQFEALMRVTLFDRVGKRLVLNGLGSQLLPKAEEILQRIDEFAMLASSDKLTGNLSIGASKTTGNYFLPTLITEFLNQYPKISVDYTIENTDNIIKKVLSAEIDIGFIESDCFNPKLDIQTIKKDRLLIIADKKHPLAKKNQVTKKDLQEYSWILREVGSGTRKIFETYTKKFFNKLQILIELNEPEAIKKMLLNSTSLTCISEQVVQTELANKQLVALRVEGLCIERTFSMIRLADRYQTWLLKEFYGFVSEATLT